MFNHIKIPSQATCPRATDLFPEQRNIKEFNDDLLCRDGERRHWVNDNQKNRAEFAAYVLTGKYGE